MHCGRSADWIAVRRYDAPCREAADTRSGGRGRIRNADNRPLRRRFVLVGATPRSMRTITVAAALWGLTGVGGRTYALIVARRMREQSVYQPGFEDRLFHVALPF